MLNQNFNNLENISKNTFQKPIKKERNFIRRKEKR